MGTDEAVGKIVEILPNATYVVELESRKRVRAHLAPATKLNATRVRVNDKVLVKLSPHDLTRGRITKVEYESSGVGKKDL